MGARHRTRRAARRNPELDAKPLILVVTEGEVTEPQYLAGFVRACRNPRVRVEISKDHGVPRTLVERAKELKNEAARAAKKKDDENLAFDEVWCVFDIDVHSNIPEARNMARDNDISLAVSNPCFEFWLVLHLRDSPGCQHRHDMQALLRKLGAITVKSVSFENFRNGYTDAVRRASRLDQAALADGEEGRCPTTTVYQLTESIRGDSVV
jgi:hypothetical protein